MPNFIRIKDRPTPYQPETEGTHVTPIIHKRVNKGLALEDFDWYENDQHDSSQSHAYGDNTNQGNQAQQQQGHVVMDPYRTTKRKVISIETSQNYEQKYRNDTSPCILDMLKIRETLLKQKAEEEKRQQKINLRKKHQQEQLLKLELAIKNNQLDTFEFDLQENQNVELDDGEEEFHKKEGKDKEEQEMEEIDEEFKKMAIFMKERRIVRQMQSNLMHIPLSRYRRFKYSFDAAYFGGKRYGPFTEILPWLYIGRGSVAKEERFFNTLGFTHIMNCTREIPNYFPAKFIYQRIPIDDSIDEDAGAKFNRAIEFLSRVFRCKGKVYVHCTMGASRAPTMVMAYFIARRQISLLDSYRYIQALRSVVQPNAHFLFQLAQLELQQGMGSSVIYQKEWRQYEYNAIRHQIETYRKPEGVFKTCWKLHSIENALLDMPPKQEDDLLDL